MKPVKHLGITMESIISVHLKKKYILEFSLRISSFNLFSSTIWNGWHVFWNSWSRKNV